MLMEGERLTNRYDSDENELLIDQVDVLDSQGVSDLMK